MPFENTDVDGAGSRREAESQVRAAYREFARRFQLALDETLQSHGGRSADEIRPVLAARWSAINGAALGEPRLSDYAATLAAGRRITLE